MSTLLRQTGSVQGATSSGHLTQPGAGYRVVVLRAGGVASASSSGATISLHTGHGQQVGAKVLIGSSTYSGIYTVGTSGASSIVMSGGTYSVAASDTIANLGPDTGTTAPNWDGSTAVVYSTPDTTTVISRSVITVGNDGSYGYWHDGQADLWEVVLFGSTVIAINVDAFQRQTSYLGLGVYNVKDYGAKGDGATDDSVSIQALLTSLTTGGTVYFPPGQYIIGNAIYMRSNTHLAGAGIDVTILKKKASALYDNASANVPYNPIIAVGSAPGTSYTNASPGSDISVRGMTLDGNSANQTVSYYTNAHGFAVLNTYGVATGGCVDGVTIENVKVQWINGDGIRLWGCKNAKVTECTTYKTGQTTSVASKNALTFDGGTDSASGWGNGGLFSGNHISYSGDATARAAEGIALIRASNVNVVGNDISHVDYGVELTGSSGHLYNITITGNTIHDLTEATTQAQIGIACAPGSPYNVYGLTVSGNTLYNIYNNGMYLQRVYGLTVSGNTLYKTNEDSTQTTYVTGIEVLTTENFSVVGNTLRFDTPATGVYGIKVYGSSDGVVNGNTVEATSAGSILLTNDTTATLVSSNRLVGGDYNIRLSATGTNANNTLVLNHCTGAATAAILDSSGQTNYIIELDVANGRINTTKGLLKVTALDNERGVWLQNATAASVFSPKLTFSDTAGTVFHMFKSSSAILGIQNNAGSAVWQLTDAGNMDVTGHLKGANTDVNVTGNDAITTAARHLINLTNVSGTNTITLAAPSAKDGATLILRLVALTAGTLTLADSGNCVLSAAWVPDANDTLTLVANGVLWYELARSAN